MSAQLRHYINILKESDAIMKKLERSSVHPESLPDYREVATLRNTAFIELLKLGIPFIALTDDDIIKINVNDKDYQITKTYVRGMLGDDAYNSLLKQETFDKNIISQLNEEGESDGEYQKLLDRISIMEKKLEHSNEFNAAVTNSGDGDQKTFSTSSEINETEKNSHAKTSHDYQNSYSSSDSEPIIDYRVNKNGVAKLVNTTEFAFIGISQGVGTTYSAIMFAQALATEKNCDVAYFEANNSNNMKEFSKWITGEDIDTRFPLNNVDFYFGIDYLTFATKFKDSYEYVVIDFGTFSEEIDLSDFIRISSKFVVVNGVDWKLPKLSEFCQSFGQNRMITYLCPLISEDALMFVKNITAPNRTAAIPLNCNPFEPNNETISLFKSLIGLNADEENVDKKTSFKDTINQTFMSVFSKKG